MVEVKAKQSSSPGSNPEDFFPIDRLGRPLRELRISVTDRCNFRCRYCMPAEVFGEAFSFLPREALLSFEEIVRLARIFRGLGVTKLRVTGGEPLVRSGIVRLVALLGELAFEDLALTTNGVHLRKFALPLREAGLGRVNVSLDALDPEVFGRLNGGFSSPGTVLDGIEAAAAAGLAVKLNTVVQRGVNEAEIVPLARLCQERGWVLRFIEYMDVGDVNGWDPAAVVSGREIRERLADGGIALEPLRGDLRVARYWKPSEGGPKIGFIESISNPFCAGCTRARISAQGSFQTCLFSDAGTDLLSPLREGLPDREIREIIAATWNRRRDRYSEERTEQRARGHRNFAEMWQVGG